MIVGETKKKLWGQNTREKEMWAGGVYGGEAAEDGGEGDGSDQTLERERERRLWSGGDDS